MHRIIYDSYSPTLQHVSVGVVSDGEQMRRHFVPPLALVLLDDILAVDGQTPVGVDRNAEQARIRLQILTEY